MGHDAKATDDETTTPAKGGNDTDHTRADFFKPFAAKCRRKAKKDDGNRENPDNGLQAPVAGACTDHAKFLDQWRVEDTPGIDGANTQMNSNGCWRHFPAIEIVTSDDVFFFELVKHSDVVLPVFGFSLPFPVAQLVMVQGKHG